MKKELLFGTGAVVLVVVCVCAFILAKGDGTYYYSQIDNSKLKHVGAKGGVINLSGSLDYSYTLFSYNEDEKGRDITFGTSRELKEGAFIRLTVVPIRGVVEWSEVQYDELPAAVQEQYTVSK